MRRSKAEIYFHLVWTTYERLPLIGPEIEREIYRCIEEEARKLNCTVLALGGMPDHVHLLVKLPTRLSASDLMQKVKGVSSTFTHVRLLNGELFKWQEGYGVFSVSRSHVRRVTAYIEDQKRHHANRTVWNEWEATDEEIEPL